jgi:hypothetical protein
MHKTEKLFLSSISRISPQKDLQMPLLDRKQHLEGPFPHDSPFIIPIYFVLRNVRKDTNMSLRKSVVS